MSRNARIKVARQPFHVIQRGNNRMEFFRGEEDFVLYLGLLNELAPRFSCDVHAYVLMPNHVHILLSPQEADGMSAMMKNLGQRYAQRFNRVYGRTGSLFEGRFKSCLVHDASYLFTCQRYIELNPVRARMVDGPWQYPWGSYRANAGREVSMLLKRHRLYDRLGTTDEERSAAYRDLFRDPLTDDELEEIRTAVNGGFALGTREFVAAVEMALKRRARPGAAGRPRKTRAVVLPDGKLRSVPGF